MCSFCQRMKPRLRELPQSVTQSSIHRTRFKGDTATNASKPAKLEQARKYKFFIHNEGDSVRIDRAHGHI